MYKGAGGLHDHETIAGPERVGEFGTDEGDLVPAERDRLAGSEMREFRDLAHGAAVTIGRFGARMGGMNTLVLAPLSVTSPRPAPVLALLIIERVGR